MTSKNSKSVPNLWDTIGVLVLFVWAVLSIKLIVIDGLQWEKEEKAKSALIFSAYYNDTGRAVQPNSLYDAMYDSLEIVHASQGYDEYILHYRKFTPNEVVTRDDQWRVDPKELDLGWNIDFDYGELNTRFDGKTWVKLYLYHETTPVDSGRITITNWTQIENAGSAYLGFYDVGELRVYVQTYHSENHTSIGCWVEFNPEVNHIWWNAISGPFL